MKSCLLAALFYVRKTVIFSRDIVWYVTAMASDVLVLTGISEGQRVRLTRLSKGLRQIDLASMAKVNPIDITRLENDRYVLPIRRKRILSALELTVESHEADGQE